MFHEDEDEVFITSCNGVTGGGNRGRGSCIKAQLCKVRVVSKHSSIRCGTPPDARGLLPDLIVVLLYGGAGILRHVGGNAEQKQSKVKGNGQEQAKRKREERLPLFQITSLWHAHTRPGSVYIMSAHARGPLTPAFVRSLRYRCVEASSLCVVPGSVCDV